MLIITPKLIYDFHIEIAKTMDCKINYMKLIGIQQ